MKFEDLTFEHNKYMNGEQAVHMFDNYYGVSVVRGQYTYGGKKGLYELAVIHMGPEDKESTIMYDTPITDDVIGYLTPEGVTDIMKQVKELPTRE
jgi:hypothetical protein